MLGATQGIVGGVVWDEVDMVDLGLLSFFPSRWDF
jgi:hypothetical protein